MPHSSPLRNVISVFSFCSVISSCPSFSPGNSFIVGSSSVPSSLISLSQSSSLCPSLRLCLWHSRVPFFFHFISLFSHFVRSCLAHSELVTNVRRYFGVNVRKLYVFSFYNISFEVWDNLESVWNGTQYYSMSLGHFCSFICIVYSWWFFSWKFLNFNLKYFLFNCSN